LKALDLHKIYSEEGDDGPASGDEDFEFFNSVGLECRDLQIDHSNTAK